MPKIIQKVINVFEDQIRNEFLREEIIDLVMNAYPGTNRASVITSDYCYNMVNQGIILIFIYLNLSEKGDTAAWGVSFHIPELFIGSANKLENGRAEDFDYGKTPPNEQFRDGEQING
jgi:hypothetical protein